MRSRRDYSGDAHRKEGFCGWVLAFPPRLPTCCGWLADPFSPIFSMVRSAFLSCAFFSPVYLLLQRVASTSLPEFSLPAAFFLQSCETPSRRVGLRNLHLPPQGPLRVFLLDGQVCALAHNPSRIIPCCSFLSACRFFSPLWLGD